jgi:hypothetical protein
MGYIRQRTVCSKAETRLLRWRLKQQRMSPLPRKKDLEELRQEAEREVRANAQRLGVFE